jgi:outer membrane protein OmpA-like peptidoglycan-associated protein
VLLVGALWVAPPAAGAEPDAQAMIEALKPPVTRSLRNLVVRPTASASAAAADAPASPSSSPSAATVPTGAPTTEATASTPPDAPSLALAVGFDFDSARIRPDSMGLLRRLAGAMRSPELAGSRFLIEGHTDARGGAAYNLRLSQARAQEVQRFLVTEGVDASRLQSVGRGASMPTNAADPLAPENRRVRVVNIE